MRAKGGQTRARDLDTDLRLALSELAAGREALLAAFELAERHRREQAVAGALGKLKLASRELDDAIDRLEPSKPKDVRRERDDGASDGRRTAPPRPDQFLAPAAWCGRACNKATRRQKTMKITHITFAKPIQVGTTTLTNWSANSHKNIRVEEISTGVALYLGRFEGPDNWVSSGLRIRVHHANIVEITDREDTSSAPPLMTSVRERTRTRGAREIPESASDE